MFLILQLISYCLLLVPLEMFKILLGQFRVVPADKNVFRILVRCGGRIVEATKLDGLLVRNYHFVVVDLIGADGPHITTDIDENR